MVLRLIRGFLGGIMLGVTSTAGVAAALALPLTFCGMRDVKSLAAVTAGQPRRMQTYAIAVFALAFPCGAMASSSLYLGVRLAPTATASHHAPPPRASLRARVLARSNKLQTAPPCPSSAASRTAGTG